MDFGLKKNKSGLIVPYDSSEETSGETQQQMPNIPETMPVVPVSGAVLYPFIVFPFFVRGARTEKAVDAAAATNNFIFVVATRQREYDPTQVEPSKLYQTGTIGVILKMMRDPSGGIKMMVQGLQRAEATSMEMAPEGYLRSGVRLLTEKEYEMSEETSALMRSVHSQLQEASKLGKSLPQEFLGMISDIKDPGRLADLIASTLELEPADAQNIIEELDPEKRLNYVLRLLAGEIKILEIQNKIKSNVQEEMDERQKKYYLNEQLKAIQKELGHDDPHKSQVNELRERIEDAGMTEQAKEQSLKELDRLGQMHPDSAEAGVVRTYIEWMISLPWSESSEDRLDLKHARKVLDNDHHGLDKVKERIIETLAIRKLHPEAKSPIICFVGPPGVGKTSLGQSIARALNRRFYRFSVGGVRDESEIRGHRRTYVGSMPGRIISGLKNAGTNNPVFMIDEIDKMGSDFRGDPSSAML